MANELEYYSLKQIYAWLQEADSVPLIEELQIQQAILEKYSYVVTDDKASSSAVFRTFGNHSYINAILELILSQQRPLHFATDIVGTRVKYTMMLAPHELHLALVQYRTDTGGDHDFYVFGPSIRAHELLAPFPDWQVKISPKGLLE